EAIRRSCRRSFGRAETHQSVQGAAATSRSARSFRAQRVDGGSPRSRERLLRAPGVSLRPPPCQEGPLIVNYGNRRVTVAWLRAPISRVPSPGLFLNRA